MKLYYAPGTCALASHIVLEELGEDYWTEKVSTKSHMTESGQDFYQVNAKGYVPALELNDGDILTEGPAIMQYLVDERPGSSLAPPCGTIARAQLQSWLTYIGTEVHKSFSPLFSPTTSAEARDQFKEKIVSRLGYIETQLADGRDYLTGENFTIADAYLFAVARWAPGQGIALEQWPWLAALVGRIRERPAVRRALRAEGLD